DDVEAALGRQLLAALRDERGLVGLHLTGDVGNGVDRGHFEVETVGDDRPQQADVAVLDVAPVLAQVDGDAVGAGEEGEDGRRDGVGLVAAPCLPHRGDVVDVEAEADHGNTFVAACGNHVTAATPRAGRGRSAGSAAPRG